MYDIRCGKECGFVVDGGYFNRKQRFQVPYCPRCASPVIIVNHGTLDRVPGAVLVESRADSGLYGTIQIQGVAS